MAESLPKKACHWINKIFLTIICKNILVGNKCKVEKQSTHVINFVF